MQWSKQSGPIIFFRNLWKKLHPQILWCTLPITHNYCEVGTVVVVKWSTFCSHDSGLIPAYVCNYICVKLAWNNEKIRARGRESVWGCKMKKMFWSTFIPAANKFMSHPPSRRDETSPCTCVTFALKRCELLMTKNWKIIIKWFLNERWHFVHLRKFSFFSSRWLWP